MGVLGIVGISVGVVGLIGLIIFLNRKFNDYYCNYDIETYGEEGAYMMWLKGEDGRKFKVFEKYLKRMEKEHRGS